MKVERPGDTFIAYADGSCLKSKNGGWAVTVYVGGTPVEFSGSATEATNNQMELTAVIRALEALPAASTGVLRTDSNYVVKGITEWRTGWEKAGWRNARRKPILNKDLWLTLFGLVDARPNVRFAWVKGHADDPGNIRVDALALAAAQALRG